MFTNCFVIMGFGEKLCPSSHRIINLDHTYSKLIKPVLESLNICGIRADEVQRSSIIDADMYQFIIDADLVIADITTLNANAIYELGVRHAVRPYTTIIVAEEKTTLPFDLNHVRILRYKYDMGISKTECTRFRSVLVQAVNASTAAAIDSPLYATLNLIPPQKNSARKNMVHSQQLGETLATLIGHGAQAKERNDFGAATDAYRKALAICKDSYIVKELAICTYKQDENDLGLLEHASNIINQNIDISQTSNHDILSVMGAIYKKIWLIEQSEDRLLKAIEYYEKAYMLSNHYYYPGLNVAFLLLNLAAFNCSDADALISYCKARSIFGEILRTMESINKPYSFWEKAALTECYFVLGKQQYEQLLSECKALTSAQDWKIKSLLCQLDQERIALEYIDKKLPVAIQPLFNRCTN